MGESATLHAVIGGDLKASTVDLGEISLAVAREGEGGSPLMLVHGFTGAKEDFADWIAPLAAAGLDVAAPDMRGHGASDKPADEAAYTFETFADDLVGLADALGWGRFTLLGHSMGGMAAQHVALSSPDRLERLILMDTTHGPIEGIDGDMAAAGAAYAREQGIDALADFLAEIDSPLDSPANERLLAERSGYAEFGEYKLRSSSPAMYAAMVGAMVDQPDRLERLAGLGVPTLVIVGSLDEPFIEASRRMAETIPDVTLAVIPDAGHSPQFEAPQAWIAAISRFLGVDVSSRVPAR